MTVPRFRFRRLAPLLLAACASLSLPSPARAEMPKPPANVFPQDVFAHAPGEDTVDVILFGAGRAAVVRFHVRVGGKPFRSGWGDFAVRLHSYLDRNNDGVLTTDEANRAPWTNLLLNPLNGNVGIRPGIKPTSIDASPKDGKVSFEELVNYLQGTQNFEPFASQAGPPPDPRAEAVFGQMDRDGDKALAAGEVAETESLVARLDRDEDETLSLDEFTPDRSPFADRFRQVNQNAMPVDDLKSPAADLASEVTRKRVAERIMRAYAKAGTNPRSRRIGPEPLNASSSAFAAADRDHDGSLDLDELARYLAAPTPHLELSVTLSDKPPAAGKVEKLATPGDTPTRAALTTRDTGGGGIAVDFEGSEIEFRASDSINNNGASNLLEQQFMQADANKDGAVSAQEARGNFFMQRMHPVADRNGDGKMTRAEMKAYLDLNAVAELVRTKLTVADRGVALMEKLDANRDNRLSRRELRGAKAKLADLDLNHDGRVTLAELPRRSLLNLGRGPAVNQNRGVVNVAPARTRTGGPAGRPPLPVWFVKMDRNSDGDVSPREFLGTPDNFRAFDSDKDGLIDPKEASESP